MDEKNISLRSEVINLATSLALENNTKRKETEVIGECLEEACLRLNIGNKEFIKMFI